MEQQVTPEQKAALKKIEIKARKSLLKVRVRLIAMLLFFSGVTLVISVLFLPGNGTFVFLSNLIGGILALVDCIEGTDIAVKEFREEEKKILRGFFE